ncbi:MAG: hypothetical protein OEW04_04355 [Nitrospirota bacterium]|nr:hypothetical protein [Nitrospirota bacterium]
MKIQKFISSPFAVAFLVAGWFLFIWPGHSFSEMGGKHEHPRDVHGHAHSEESADAVMELTSEPRKIMALEPAALRFSIKNHDGDPLQGITISHERILHVVIISEDFSVFSHIHPEDFGPITENMIMNARFALQYTFPRAGRYLIAADTSANGKHLSKQFIVTVSGKPALGTFRKDLSREKNFGAYHVVLKTAPEHVEPGGETELEYAIDKNGNAVTDFEPYLAAPMHIAVLLTDLQRFIHAHGEVPGASPTPHVGHIHGAVQGKFGPVIKAHVTFPAKGIYVLFSEVKHQGKIILMDFMINVE